MPSRCCQKPCQSWWALACRFRRTGPIKLAFRMPQPGQVALGMTPQVQAVPTGTAALIARRITFQEPTPVQADGAAAGLQL